MEKEKKQLRPKFWLFRIITYIYLPLSIALNIYLSLGNYYSIGRLNLDSIFSVFEAVDLMLPYLTVFLFTISLVGLLGLTSFGRKSIMFSTFLRNILFCLLIASSLLSEDLRRACSYTILCFIGILIYLYFSHRSWMFIKGGQRIKEAKAKLRKAQEEKEEVKEEKETLPAQEEEKKEEEEETEKKEDEKEPKEEHSFVLSEIDSTYPQSDIIRKKRIIYAFTETGTPVKLIASTFSIFKTKTVIEIEVENTSDEVYTRSIWEIGETTVESAKVIKPGKNIILFLSAPAIEEAGVKLIKVESAL